jgi:hypothetical protein
VETTENTRPPWMRPSLIALGIAASIAALLTTASVVVADSAGTVDKPLQFDLISRATKINNFVDIGPAGFSPGDLYVFSDNVFRPSDPTTAVGRFDGRCTLLDPATARWDCSVATSLPDGTIRGAGALTLVQGSVNAGAITGGTGRYRNARGQGTVELGPFEGPHNLHFSVILSP